MQIQALLIDLDGTLLLYDVKEFASTYLKLTAPYFPEIENAQFVNYMIKAEQCMYAKKEPEGTPIDAFLTSFCADTLFSPDEVMERFETFYQTDFDQLKHLISFRIPNGAIKFLKEIKKHDLSLVLATNPVFPLIAVEKRLEFVGLQVNIFDHITTGENSRFTKPNPNYYRDIAETIEIAPKKCLMVGNDINNDILPAKEIGMQTFFFKEVNKLSRGEISEKYQSGSFNSLSQLIF